MERVANDIVELRLTRVQRGSIQCKRRHGHGETNAIVATKANAARRAGLLAIICIETESHRADSRTSQVCRNQITGSVPERTIAAETAIAHEPDWNRGAASEARRHVPERSDQSGSFQDGLDLIL